MKVSLLLVLIVVLQVCVQVSAHGKLILPLPRNGIGLNGNSVIKLTPFSNYTVDDATCGNARNNDPGPSSPTTVFQAGSSITVVWRTTIHHKSAPGVRVAVWYSNTDGFDNNVIAVGQEIGAQSDYAKGITGCHNLTVPLPAGKTSNNAVIQWVWASEEDGGYYTSCADVKIQAAPVTSDTNNYSLFNNECIIAASSSSSSSSASSTGKQDEGSNAGRIVGSMASLFVALLLVSF